MSLPRRLHEYIRNSSSGAEPERRGFLVLLLCRRSLRVREVGTSVPPGVFAPVVEGPLVPSDTSMDGSGEDCWRATTARGLAIGSNTSPSATPAAVRCNAGRQVHPAQETRCRAGARAERGIARSSSMITEEEDSRQKRKKKKKKNKKTKR